MTEIKLSEVEAQLKMIVVRSQLSDQIDFNRLKIKLINSQLNLSPKCDIYLKEFGKALTDQINEKFNSKTFSIFSYDSILLTMMIKKGFS